MDYQLIDNTEKNQYEFHVKGFMLKIQYKMAGGKIFLTHTEVPVELQGKGIGNVLVKEVLEDIGKMELKLVPVCPFVAAYIKRHPEWDYLVSKQ